MKMYDNGKRMRVYKNEEGKNVQKSKRTYDEIRKE
jgi:hypothetical protein